LEWLEDRVVPTNNQTISVAAGDTTGLINAILQGDSFSGSTTINLAAGSTYDITQTFVSTQGGVNGFWFGPEGLPPITNTITINGNGATIERAPSATTSFRLFFVSGFPQDEGNTAAMTPGDLTLNNLTLKNGVAHGGNANGGGGGLGAGGAIFNQGIVTLNGVTLTNNSAIGGSGGVTTISGLGGGGMGSDADNAGNGGGMGGPLSAGPLPNLPQGGAGSKTNGAGGGGAGFSTNGSPAQTGGHGGAGGGSSALATVSGDGGDGSFAFQGSGIGGNGGAFGSGGSPGVGGGGGGVGGGGGGATNNANGGDGGDGGFGGGGGGFGGRVGVPGSGNFAGYGGFGGGDGKNDSTALPDQHNFGGGNGGSPTNANVTGGGGGAGMGGAVFNMFGTITIINSTISGNLAMGGNAATGSQGGGAYGGGLFNLDGTANLVYATVANNIAFGGTSGAGGDPSLADGAGVFNLAYANTPGGGPATAVLSLENSLIEQNPGNGGFDLGNMAQSAPGGTGKGTAHITGSTNLIQSDGGVHQGNGTTTVDSGVFLPFALTTLGPLQNNGGPTFTQALPPGTPGAGQANPTLPNLPTVDQRGLPRPTTQGQDDLGAYQNQANNTQPTSTAVTASASANGTTSTTVNLTATVTSNGTPVTQGKVTFTLSGMAVGNTTVNAQGQATISITVTPALAPGNYPVTAAYADTASPPKFSPSTGNTTLTVSNSTGAPTTTTITSTAVSSTFSSTTAQPVTLTATVTSSGATVNEGTVTFTVNGTTASAPVKSGAASATFNVPAGTLAGTYAIAAAYADTGGTLFASSTATKNGTLTVGPAATQTAVANQSTPFSSAAQSVTLTATVTSLGGGTVKEGNVTFTLGTLPAVTGPVNAQGVASASISLPAGFAVGSYPLTASYADTANTNKALDYGPSTAPAATFTVNAATTTVSVGSAGGAFNPGAGQSVTLTATLTSNGKTVTEGTVTFSVAGQKATATVGTSGQASTSISLPAGLDAGVYPISASYADSSSLFGPGTGSGTLTVAAAATQTAVTSTNVSAGFKSGSQQVTLSAAVTSPVATLNEGTVTFMVGSLTAQGPVSNGTATAQLTLPGGFAAGTYTIGAHFADKLNTQAAANYAASDAATTGSLVIGSAGTSLTASDASATFSSAAQHVTLQANLTSPGGGTVTEGTVTFTLGSLPAVQATVGGSGQASASLTLPAGFAAGSYAFSASYTDPTNANNVADFTPSTAGAMLTVGTAATQLKASDVSTPFSAFNPHTLTLSATVSGPNGNAGEGTVTFSVGGQTATAPVNSSGVASTTLTLPAGLAAGSYPITAAYADPANAQGLLNFSASTGSASLTLATANTAVQLQPRAIDTSFNATTGQVVQLTAGVNSPDGGTVTEGTVLFALGSLSASAAVNDGTATTTLSLPAGFAAGSYPVSAAYADTANSNGVLNFAAASAAGTLSVQSALSQTALTAITTTFNGAVAQPVTLTAAVTSPSGGPVNEGSVTFAVAGLTATAPVSGGAASAVVTLPAGLAAGRYAVTASYADPANASGVANFLASGQASALIVGPSATNTTLSPPTVSGSFSSGASQQVTLTATASSGGVPVGEGTVTFVVPGLPAVKAAVKASGVASTTLTLPAGFAAGDYAVTAGYTDSSNVNGAVNFTASSGGGTLHLDPVATAVSVSSASAGFTTSTQQVALHASVTSPTAGPVNEGTVTFSVAGLSATAPVLNGSANVALNLPGSLGVGTYPLTASYADSSNANGVVNLTASAANGTLTVSQAATQLSVSSLTVVASGGAQAVTLSAAVSSSNGPVDEGTVTFTAAGQTVTAAVHGGAAAASVTLPPGFPTGQYAITASYADAANSNGLLNLTPAAASGTLTVVRTSAVTITGVSLTPGLGSVTETVTAQVTSPSGPVTSGSVTFSVGGVQVQAAVNNGTATASVTVPAGAALGPQGISATFADASGQITGSSASRTAFLSVFSAFLPGAVTIGADGSEVLTLSFFGIPLTFVFNAAGQLTGLFFGSLPLLI
jgi:hypothetical protein